MTKSKLKKCWFCKGKKDITWMNLSERCNVCNGTGKAKPNPEAEKFYGR